MSRTETEPETELRTPKSLAFLNWIIKRIEDKAERGANNHELLSKMTFILVLAMSYEILGDRIVSLVALLL
jgi:hypothetical protein